MSIGKLLFVICHLSFVGGCLIGRNSVSLSRAGYNTLQMNTPIKYLRLLGILYYIQGFLALIGILLSITAFVYVYSFYAGGLYAYKPYNDEGWDRLFLQLSTLGTSALSVCCLAAITVLSILEGSRIRRLRSYMFCRSAAMFQAALTAPLALFLLLESKWFRLVGSAGFVILVVWIALQIAAFRWLSQPSVQLAFQKAKAEPEP